VFAESRRGGGGEVDKRLFLNAGGKCSREEEEEEEEEEGGADATQRVRAGCFRGNAVACCGVACTTHSAKGGRCIVLTPAPPPAAPSSGLWRLPPAAVCKKVSS